MAGPSRDLNPAQRIHSPICYQATLLGPSLVEGAMNHEIFIYSRNARLVFHTGVISVSLHAVLYIKRRKTFIMEIYY
jgi:hypothetical protein